MNSHIHACIAYIVCRLISGRKIASLYDCSESRIINIAGLPDAKGLSEFDEKHRDYVPGYASGCMYEYSFKNGHSIEVFITESTFVVHVNGSSAYFIGNVLEDKIYIYDHRASAHFYYRIDECAVEQGKTV
ncbi:MAG: hypothetical protein AB1632_06575 [Nitrospirota bacterium]